VKAPAAVPARAAYLASDWGAPASATYDAGVARTIYVGPGGSDTSPGLTASKPKATLAGALTAIGIGNLGTVRLLPGVIPAGSGVSLSGYACEIIGSGDASVITATAQTGPVLNFSGYASPAAAKFRRRIGNFRVQGDGTAGIAKKGVYLGLLGASPGGLHFYDISVDSTGGPGFDFGAAQLCDFSGIVVHTPVSAKANDVPYFAAAGACNGNRFYGLGLRSTVESADTGVSGGLAFTADATYAPEHNEFTGLWVEYLHPPTNGCLLSITGNNNLLDAVQFFDCSKETGATGTAHIRLLAPVGVQNYGGNEIRGVIPGNGGGTGVAIDLGVVVSQSCNRIVGVKGFQGANVVLNTGVGFTYVELGGSVSNGATAAAFTDNSGQTTNVLIDHIAQRMQFGLARIERDTLNEGWLVSRADGGQPGITLRSSTGPRWYSTTATGDTHRSDTLEFQGLDATALGYVDKFAGWRFDVGVGFGKTPVARGAAILNADGTLADLTAKFNALLAYLRSRGDIAP